MIQQGRVAMVTGAGSGIGREIAVTLAKRGVKVAGFDLNQDAAEETSTLIAQLGGEAIAASGNVANRDNCFAAVENILKKWGRLDIQVNCAGVLIDNVIKKITDENWDLVHSINLKGTLYCIQAALEPMKEGRYGRIVNLSSGACVGKPGQAAYSTSKAAVVTLTKVAAQEFSRYAITVNCIAPGFVETPMTAGMPIDAFEKIVSSIPLGRIGKPEDIAHLAMAFVADEAGYITGQTVFVDGGSSLGKKL